MDTSSHLDKFIQLICSKSLCLKKDTSFYVKNKSTSTEFLKHPPTDLQIPCL